MKYTITWTHKGETHTEHCRSKRFARATFRELVSDLTIEAIQVANNETNEIVARMRWV